MSVTGIGGRLSRTERCKGVSNLAIRAMFAVLVAPWRRGASAEELALSNRCYLQF